MSSPLALLAAGVLLLHGVVHVLGTGVYLGALDLPAFQYTTTLMAGRIDVGHAGMRVVGILWGVAAGGFAVSAAAILADWDHWPVLLGAVTALSLLLTGLAVTVAYGGFAMNLAILAALLVYRKR